MQWKHRILTTGLPGNFHSILTKVHSILCAPRVRNQEGRRGLNEVVPGTSVFPLSETGVLGDFWHTPAACSFPGEKARSWGALGGGNQGPTPTLWT